MQYFFVDVVFRLQINQLIYMKKIIAFLAIGAMLVSCSNDDDNQNEEFFNLAEGNFWVYKRYSASPENPAGVFINIIDTVRVEGQQIINGVSYYRITHSVTNSFNGHDEFLRVNEKGHLVRPNGFVMHPGTDKIYQHTQKNEGESWGTDYQLEEVKNIIVEGKNYMVYPYVGYFTSTSPVPPGIGTFESYQKGLGLVVRHCRFVSSTAYFEDRLISYQVK